MKPALETGSPSPFRYLLRVLAAALVVSVLLGLFDTGQYFVYQELEGKPVPWQKLALYNLPYWWIGALLIPPVALLARRLSYAPGRRLRITALHICCAIVFAHVHVGALQLYYAALNSTPVFSMKFVNSVAKHLTRVVELDMLIYAVVVAGVLLIEANRSYRKKERTAARLAVETARLEASLSAARLETLKMQLQPHFLFNALHAVSTLIMRGDNDAAHRMLLHLSDFLRMTLDNNDAAEVPLAVELEFLDAYVQIQRVRFGDRLQVNFDVAPAARLAAVPNLVLQPLVENSIRHGIGTGEGRGTIAITAQVKGEQLVIEVRDDGSGIGQEPLAEGIGLGNIRARLRQLYPGAHNFTLEPGAPQGTVATLTLPLRRLEASPATALA